MKKMIKSLTLMLSAAAMLCTTGCMGSTFLFDRSDNYTTGDFSTISEIISVDIDWTSGSVTVLHHDQSEVTVTETSSSTLEDSQRLQTWLDGSTLHIRFCKPVFSFGRNTAKKNLEIRLPNGMELDSLECDCTSADTTFTDISADSFDVDITSGSVLLDDCSSGKFNLESTSGDITVNQRGSSESLSANSTSGLVSITAETVKELKLHSTSGDIKVNRMDNAESLTASSTSGLVSITADTVKNLKLHSTSGEKTARMQNTDAVSATGTSGSITLYFGILPASTAIDTTSGTVSLFLPQDAEFTANVDTTSGKFYSDLPLTKDGDTYIAGSGSGQISIDSTSGDVVIRNAE